MEWPLIWGPGGEDQCDENVLPREGAACLLGIGPSLESWKARKCYTSGFKNELYPNVFHDNVL